MTIFQVFAFAVNLVFAVAAPPLALSSLQPSSLLPSNSDINLSLPSNSSLLNSGTTPPHLPHLPHEDYVFLIPSSVELLKLWDYGALLPKESVLGILHSAQRDIAVNIKAGVPMGPQALHYASPSGNVRLLIHVKGMMTWEIFSTALRGLRLWMERWEFVECDFNIGHIGFESLFGTGVFVGLDKRVARVDSS